MNNIPSIRSAGKFVADVPYDKVVNPEVFYTVEAIRTLPEMQALKIDLFTTVFQPVGYTTEQAQQEIQTAIDNKAVVVSLTSRGRGPVYVLSTFLKSIPLLDGVIYENLALIVSLGACPPSMKDRINVAIEHINNYIKECVGINDPNTTLGTIPTRGYVSKETADSWERSRQLQITEEPSDTVKLAEANKTISELQTYIEELEATITGQTNP
ncbi:hypothetical protein PS2_0208 [Aeromonas phage PS2]|uniref:Uncharacterized protein n=1 Tax=Aeromonas phage PS1 TaxID=2591406 RepID=A0A514TUL3_9CAUD|nr:hypothetical protein PQC64_gp057 [Aeromonas phage PS1]QDJ96717.1 hypothetical protein PS1_0206 [Aeromonas phage PS1]QFR59350.1 hypothetical protein PS2_0208 [Aeromonas phage PS2]